MERFLFNHTSDEPYNKVFPYYMFCVCVFYWFNEIPLFLQVIALPEHFRAYLLGILTSSGHFGRVIFIKAFVISQLLGL